MKDILLLLLFINSLQETHVVFEHEKRKLFLRNTFGLSKLSDPCKDLRREADFVIMLNVLWRN